MSEFMPIILSCPEATKVPAKFAKNISFSSLATESSCKNEKRYFYKKISDKQKSELVRLIKQENFNMKEVNLTLYRLLKLLM